MLTFIIGLVILIGGAALYGRFCEKDSDPTTAKRLPIPRKTALTMSP